MFCFVNHIWCVVLFNGEVRKKNCDNSLVLAVQDCSRTKIKCSKKQFDMKILTQKCLLKDIFKFPKLGID